MQDSNSDCPGLFSFITATKGTLTHVKRKAQFAFGQNFETTVENVLNA